MISIICYFSVVSVVFAFNMSVYSSYNYYNHRISSEPTPILDDMPYVFLYNLNDELKLDVKLKNIAPSVLAAAYITQQPGVTSRKNTIPCKNNEPCLNLRGIKLNSSSISIELKLYAGNTPCATQASRVFMAGNMTDRKMKDPDICVQPNVCIISIDLKNVCNGGIVEQSPSESTSSPSNTLPYVISSVIAITCVLIMVICLFVKKFCHRNSSTVKTIEMNSIDPSKEVLYAELGFEQDPSRLSDRRPPPLNYKEEESPYAQIVGVLKPTYRG